MTAWTPDDATVEKAARAMCVAADAEPDEFLVRISAQRWEAYVPVARAAPLAVVPGIVAEAVKAEAEACAALTDAHAAHYGGAPNDETLHPQARCGASLMVYALRQLAVGIRERTS